MLEPIRPERVRERLSRWLTQDVYVHVEVNPGAYWRNGRARLLRSHVKGEGPYRVFLELDNGVGLIHVDDLTHMELSEDTVVCVGFDEHQRLARAIEVAVRPFSM